MLDLNELEKRLDEALENETSQSLRDWLFNQRKDNLENFLGEGFIQCFGYLTSSYNQTNSMSDNNAYVSNNEQNPSSEFAPFFKKHI